MGNKLAAYVGFAKRSRKIALGVGAVEALKSPPPLLIADSGASENTKKKIEKLRTRFACPLVYVEDLEGITGKAFCKLAAISDENLARAIGREAGIMN